MPKIKKGHQSLNSYWQWHLWAAFSSSTGARTSLMGEKCKPLWGKISHISWQFNSMRPHSISSDGKALYWGFNCENCNKKSWNSWFSASIFMIVQTVFYTNENKRLLYYHCTGKHQKIFNADDSWDYLEWVQDFSDHHLILARDWPVIINSVFDRCVEYQCFLWVLLVRLG